MKYLMLNHKMNLTFAEAKKYVNEFKELKSNKCELVVFPSYLYLSMFNGDNYSLGSQNVAIKDMGALTGEVAASQLKDLNCKYSLVGHSERREIIKEDDNDFIAKINELINNGIIPVLCVGENKSERESGNTYQVLEQEIISVFSSLDTDSINKIIIAYEPIWAIGTGLVPTNEDIDDTVVYIKKLVKDNYDINIKVLYGGSVNDKNISELDTIPSIDGYLVGGASLDIEKVKTMIKEIN